MKKIISLFCVLAILFAFCACSKNEPTESKPDLSTSGDSKADSSEHPQVLVKMKDGGEFTIELYPEYAPKTVENFLNLVDEHFYDGTEFHRVIKNFMAQGGEARTDYKEKLTPIYGEFASNGFPQNTLSHTRGVISMARSSINDSATSQFFICYSDACSTLDESYAAFGKVINGMEVVDDFTNIEMERNDFGELAHPTTPIIIESITAI